MEVALSPSPPGTPRRILYIIPIAWWGGSQRYVFDMAQAAQHAGHEVLVATGEGELPERLREAGIPVAVRKHFKRGFHAFSELSFLFETMALMRDFRPDIVHANNSKGGFVGVLAARLTGVGRVVFTAHGWAFTEKRPFWQRAIFWLAHYITVLLADRTICVSNDIRRHAMRMPFIARKLVVIPNGVEKLTLLSREEARAHIAPTFTFQVWVGSIAELHPNKDLGTLIEAFSQVAAHDEHLCLVIIGEGTERARLQQLINTRGLEKRVQLAGHVTNAATYLSAFDIFVLPSRTEALGYALLEAGSASLAAIGTNTGGIPEILKDGETGLLFPVGDVSVLASLLTRYAHDAELRARMGAALHKHVSDSFSKEQMIEKTLTVYAHPS